jgi:AcrR family transcriptional regulator
MPPQGPPGEVGRPYGGRSPDERRAERRRRLLAAALELYGTAGFRNTSVAQVCRAAKVAPSKFYEEFSTSDDLLVALCLGIWEPVRDRVLTDMGAAAPSVPRMMRAGVEAYCRGLLEDPRRARVLCIELRAMSSDAEAARHEQIVQFATLSQVGFQAISATNPSPRLDDRQLGTLATALVGAIDEAMRHWLVAPEPRAPIDDLIEVLATVYRAVGSYLVTGDGSA